MNVIIIVLFYLAFSIPMALSLKKANKNKEFIIFMVFMIIAFTHSVLISQGVKVPSVDKIVGDWVLSMVGE